MRQEPLPKGVGKARWMLLWCLFLLNSAFAQTMVSGVVKDQTGLPLPGVNILLKGTTTGVVSSSDGAYRIEAPSDGTLVFSFIGYMTSEVPVNSQSVINVQLNEDIASLQEVVVVGYGTLKKSDVTGSVASVAPKNLQEVITIDVNNAMQGRVAGVQVINNSGRPGGGSTVRIRGNGSMNGSDPLYVVDGFPTGDISFLAPSDIESMEVLKDASASAIYGNRGANGVILITTKKGKAGTAQFNFNAYTGVQTPVKTLDLLNAHEYASLYLEAWTNDGKDPSDPAVMSTQNYEMLNYVIENKSKGTDWQDEVSTKYAPIQNYSFDLSGGTDKNRYRFSATYFDQQGNIKNTYLKKFFVKFNNDYKINENFSAGVAVNYLRDVVGNYNGDQYSGVLPTAIGADPITVPYDHDPLVDSWGNTQLFSQGNNPARIVDELKDQTWGRHKMVSNLWAEVKFLKDFSFKCIFSTDLNFDKSKNYYPYFVIPESSEARTVSSLSESRSTNISWNWSNFMTYVKQIEDHSINVMIGQESYLSDGSGMNASIRNVPADPDQQYLSAGVDVAPVVGSWQGHNSLLSYFGRLNYSFKGRYLFTATGRYDGSSRFADGNRWGFFPSFALGWNVANESFLTDLSWITTLKLRAGYGEVGNQAIGNNDYITTVTPGQRYSFGNAVAEGRIPTTLSNPEIVWESLNMTNFGADFGFLDDRLLFTAEYFIRDTEDMLVTIPVPQYVGAYAPRANAGTMRNSGYEFSLTYKGTAGDLKYDLGANVSFIDNELVYLGGGQPYESGGVNKVGNTTKVEEGKPFPYFFGYKTDGIFNTQEELDAYTNADGALVQPDARPGDVRFVDVNGDGVISSEDRIDLGNAYAKFQGGLSANLEYKGFDLKAFFYFLYGNKVVNSLLLWNEQPTGVLNSTKNRLNRWTPDNTASNEPRMTNENRNNNMRFSDRYVEDGSFVKLRNIQIGYTIPASVLSKARLRSVRIYISADNLWRTTKYKGYDPEFGSLYGSPYYYGVDMATYPQAKTIIGGVNLTF